MVSRPRRLFNTLQVIQMLCNETDEKNVLSDMEARLEKNHIFLRKFNPDFFPSFFGWQYSVIPISNRVYTAIRIPIKAARKNNIVLLQ